MRWDLAWSPFHHLHIHNANSKREEWDLSRQAERECRRCDSHGWGKELQRRRREDLVEEGELGEAVCGKSGVGGVGGVGVVNCQVAEGTRGLTNGYRIYLLGGPRDLSESCVRHRWCLIQDEVLPACYLLSSWILDTVSQDLILLITIPY